MPITQATTATSSRPKFNDLSSYVRDLRSAYADDKRQDSFNLLLLGEIGAGKTHLIKTARKPVLIHSFDPGGSKHLKKEIAAGEIIVDTRWENDNAKKPKTYKEWDKEFENLVMSGFLEQFGTFAIDSLTLFIIALKNHLAKIKGRSEGILQLQDWQVVGNMIRDMVNVLTDQPCDVILTGHLTLEKDEISGKQKAKLDVINSLQTAIPAMFDEIFVLEANETSQGIDRTLLTANTGKYQCRTRIGSGVFDLREKPDIKYLLKKAGMPHEDLSLEL